MAQQDSTTSASAPAGLSRRRVLVGAAWATPAVMIGVAAPPAAASVGAFGGVVLAGLAAQQAESELTVVATTAFAGPSAAAPVHTVVMQVSVPTSRVGVGTPSTPTAGWTYESSSVVGASTVFTYSWATDLTGGTVTAPLVAVIPKTTDRTAFSVDVESTGVSQGTPVTTGVTAVPVGAYSLITYNANPGGYTAGNGQNGHHTVLQGSIQNAQGWPSNNTADVVGLSLYVTVASSTLGGYTPSVAAWTPDWTYTGVTTSGSDSVFEFEYVGNGGVLAPSYNPVQFVVMIPRKPNENSPLPYTLRFEGTSPDASGAATALQSTVNV